MKNSKSYTLGSHIIARSPVRRWHLNMRPALKCGTGIGAGTYIHGCVGKAVQGYLFKWYLKMEHIDMDGGPNRFPERPKNGSYGAYYEIILY